MFGLIKAKIQPYLLLIQIVILMLIAIYIGWLKLQLGTAEGKVAKQAGEIEQWKSAYSVLTDAVSRQNAKINALDDATKEAERKYSQAKKVANTKIVARDKQIAKLSVADIKTCDDAVARAKAELIGSAL